MRRRIAFYAPLKAPDHPIPSGDRTMARQLVAALEASGHAVALASRSRSFTAEPCADAFAKAEAEADREVARLAALWSAPGAGPPDLWFSYHPYYKAPDLVGPALADRFALPYVTAEASYAPRRAAGPWAARSAATEAAIRRAALNVCFTGRDRDGLRGLLGSDARLLVLPPFIARPAIAAPSRPADRRRDGPVRLVVVAMMRPGDKARSFAALARALGALSPDPPWHLSVVGDGPARDAVRLGFAALPAERVAWLGELAPAAVAEALRRADVHVWPGFNEAFGLAYLEAAAAGLPSVAMDCGGVASVVVHGRTGLLAREGDDEGFASALRRLIEDAPLRLALGEGARRFATEERTLDRAAATLRGALARVLAAAGAAP